MALKASDVFVVQQATGAQALAKVSAYELSEWVESTGGVHYMGIADFTNAAAEPTNPNSGDLWINSAPAGGGFAWTIEPGGAVPIVAPNDRAVWNNSYWDVLPTEGESAVTVIQGTLPITVDSTTASEPIIGVNDATTTTNGVVTLATAVDVSTGSTNKVITADQLSEVIVDVDQIKSDLASNGNGTVTSVLSADPGNPISITDSTTTPTIAIKDGSIAQKGVVQMAAADDITNKVPTKVVTADQLGEVKEQLDAIDADFDNLAIDGGVYAP